MWYRRAPSLVVVATALPTLVLLLMTPGQLWAGCLVILASAGACALGWMAEHDTKLPRATWPTLGVLALLAVARSPIGSHDLWSYSFYGRVISRYHADPYATVAASYRHDLVFPLVGWRHVPTAYGPLFTGYSGVVARIAGSSLLLLRLGFQIPAAVAVLVALALLVRSGRIGPALLIGFQPFIWVSVVNGGHNDAWLALAVLVAVMLVRRRRFGWAGVALGLGSVVKLSGIIAVVPLLAMLLVRRKWREAATFAAGSLGVFALGALIEPRSLTNASRGTRSLTSIASVWRPVRTVTHLAGPVLTQASLVVVLGLVVVWSWMRRHDRDVALATGAAVSAFPLASSYSLSWYAIWGLPALALSGDLFATGLVATRGSLVLAENSLGTSVPDLVVGAVLTIVMPIVLLVAFHLHIVRTRAVSGPVDQMESAKSVGTSTTR